MIRRLFKTKVSTFVYSTLLATVIVSSTGLSYAATTSNTGFANGFTVSPVRNILSISKGQTSIVPITVENPSQDPVTVQSIINDFLPSNDETGVPRIITDDKTALPQDSFISLVSPVPDFYLGPNQQKIVNVTITAPSDAISGDYYGVIRFSPVGGGSGVVALNASVATLFLVTVPGNIYQKLSLIQFSAADVNGNTSSLFSDGQLSIVTRLVNKGTTHSEPFGNIIIKNIFGKIVDNVQFNNTNPKASILTQSTRKFITSLKKQKWLGYYTATISIGYGTNGVITAKTSFWYLPIWLDIVIILIIVIIVVGIALFVRHRRATKFGRRLK